MKIKTSELIERALDWAVAEAKGLPPPFGDASIYTMNAKEAEVNETNFWSPSTDWSQGGPLIEEVGISLLEQSHKAWPNGDKYFAAIGDVVEDEELTGSHGSTPLVAAMRCFVAFRMGDEVDIPDELIAEHHSAPVDDASPINAESPNE